MVEKRKASTEMKNALLERKASKVQKAIVDHLDPESLLELEEELRELLVAERALMKLASRINVSPARLQTIIDDFVDLINLMQL
jgi:hypothetical protein